MGKECCIVNAIAVDESRGNGSNVPLLVQNIAATKIYFVYLNIFELPYHLSVLVTANNN